MKKKIFKLPTLLFILSILFISCSKDDDSPINTTYPKEVQITYKMSSTNTATAQAISYKNESGSMTTVTNVNLPYSKTITRTVNKNDDASFGYSTTNTSSNVTLEILVDNSVKKTQNFVSGTGAMVYSFQ